MSVFDTLGSAVTNYATNYANNLGAGNVQALLGGGITAGQSSGNPAPAAPIAQGANTQANQPGGNAPQQPMPQMPSMGALTGQPQTATPGMNPGLVAPPGMPLTGTPQMQMPPGQMPQSGPAPTAPVNPNQLAQQSIPQVPPPGPGVQVAGPMVAGAAGGYPQGQPPAAQQQPMPGQPAMNPAMNPAGVTIAPPPQPAPADEAAFHAAGDDPVKLAQVAAMPNASEGVKAAARLRAKQIYEDLEKKKEAEALVQSGNSSDYAKALRSKDDQGSYFKAALYAGLGLHELAKNEQQKLGAGNTWQTAIDTAGNRAIVNYDGNNKPIEGYDAKGKRLTGDQLATFATQAGPLKGAEVGTQAMKDMATGKIYYQQRLSNGTWAYRDQSGAIAPANANLHPFGIGSDIEMKNQIQLNELQNKLAYAPIEKRASIIAESEAKYGQLPQSYKDQIMGLSTNVPAQNQIPGIIPGQLPQGAGQPSAAAAQQPTTQAPAQAQAGNAPINQAPPMTRASAGAAPAQAPAQNVVRTPAAPVAPASGGIGGTTPGGREIAAETQKAANAAEIQRQKEVALAEQRLPAEAKGKQEAKLIQQQAFADNAYPILNSINGIIKQSTGSGIGAGVDDLASLIGSSPKGAQAIAELKPLVGPLVSMVPRFEGSQSDRDVAEYKANAGDFANEKLPVKTRLAALQGMIKLLKIYDKDKNNDWGTLAPAENRAGTTSSNVTWKVVK